MKEPTEQPLAIDKQWPQPLDETQMRCVIELLDLYQATPQQAKATLDQRLKDGVLSEWQSLAVRVLFLMPAPDADGVLRSSSANERARELVSTLRPRV